MRFRSALALFGAATFAMAGAAAANGVTHDRAGATAIGRISPVAGPPKGGNVLIVAGTSLDRVSAVSFGGVRTRSITHISDQRIAVEVPKHQRGEVAVRLVANGNVIGHNSAGYRYVGPPVQLSWSKTKTIDPERGNVAAVSCPTKNFCAAVDASFETSALLTFTATGRAHRHVLPDDLRPALACGLRRFCVALAGSRVSTWNGQQWSTFSRIAPTRAGLASLSCVVGTTYCVTIGYSGATRVHQGGEWTSAGRLPRGKALTSLSCVHRTMCMATGSSEAYRFDGQHWHRAARGLGSSADLGEELTGACASPDFCLALGYAGDIYRWNGTRWHSAAFFDAHYLAAISCPSDGLCIVNNGNEIDEYSNRHWRVAHQIEQGTTFPGLSCLHDGRCVASAWAGVLTRADDKWSRPRRIEASEGYLTDISCNSESQCIAVDAHGNALQRNGSNWSAARHVDRQRAISAVSCATASFCAAVDGADPYLASKAPGTGHAVIYRNGSWRSPNVVDDKFGLTDVACASPSHCVAVDVGGRAIAWNGERWGAPRHVGAEFTAVACPSASLCIAVGTKSAVRRDGHWHHIANPTDVKYLTDVSCPTPTYCVAGGQRGFYVWHAGLWSPAVERGGYVDDVTVTCASRSVCFGSEDNEVDVWDYTFNGARSAFANDQLYGPRMSCLPTSICVAASLDDVMIGGPARLARLRGKRPVAQSLE